MSAVHKGSSHWERAALIALPVYWIALFIATHYPRVAIPGEIPHSDKLIHFSAFGLLAFLFWRFEQARRAIGSRFVWAGGLALIAYAALDEYLQQFVGRFTDLNDFIANAAGIVVVLTILELIRRRRSR
ncbi:MAG: VanZ family protein [Deltaproteobacteria bacterium]|nr:VanZ family protein [Deltaproteobacteria bacterium]